VNLDEIEADLPNGLHDSLLRAFFADETERRAEFTLDVWIGDLHSTVEQERERRRPARLELFGVSYLVVDDSDQRHLLTDRTPVQIDSCGADDDAERCRQVPQGGFAGRFFVTEWNTFIHFAAREARLTWINVN
jgi:hypothetical protein